MGPAVGDHQLFERRRAEQPGDQFLAADHGLKVPFVTKKLMNDAWLAVDPEFDATTTLRLAQGREHGCGRLLGHRRARGRNRVRLDVERKSTRLNSSHSCAARMPSSA